ncbi:MAG: hypothetical protein GY835_15735 [bacterium]|nr:hypothetical protein [bacterium]
MANKKVAAAFITAVVALLSKFGGWQGKLLGTSISVIYKLWPEGSFESECAALIANMADTVPDVDTKGAAFGAAAMLAGSYIASPKLAVDLADAAEDPALLTDRLIEQRPNTVFGLEERQLGQTRSLLKTFFAAYAKQPAVKGELSKLNRQFVRTRFDELQSQGLELAAGQRQLRDVLKGYLAVDLFSETQADIYKVASSPKELSRSSLLRAEYALVPLFGRSAELATLRDWWLDDADFNTYSIAGPGGLGKTRLMMTAVELAQRDGLSAGFLDRSISVPDLRRALTSARGNGVRTLLVIDYAEDRLELIAEAINHGLSTPNPNLRLVLLMRNRLDVSERVTGVVKDYLKVSDRMRWQEEDLRVALSDRPAAVEAAQAAYAIALDQSEEDIPP